MNKYRTKCDYIKAYQYLTNNIDNISKICKELNTGKEKGKYITIDMIDGILTIKVDRQYTVELRHGDWLINQNNNFSSLPDESFKRKYEYDTPYHSNVEFLLEDISKRRYDVIKEMTIKHELSMSSEMVMLLQEIADIDCEDCDKNPLENCAVPLNIGNKKFLLTKTTNLFDDNKICVI